MKNAIKREIVIDKLIQYGVYKIGNKQLFEVSLLDLETELKKLDLCTNDPSE